MLDLFAIAHETQSAVLPVVYSLTAGHTAPDAGNDAGLIVYGADNFPEPPPRPK